MKIKTKQYLKSIAKMYGAKLTFGKGQYGYYIPGTNKIFVGTSGTRRTTVSIFCHELSHYFNFLDGKYAKYHRAGNFAKKFKSKKRAARYALDAELYTDKRGRRVCKQYFPTVKYTSHYKDNEAFLSQMYNKYFGGKYYIIILQK